MPGTYCKVHTLTPETFDQYSDGVSNAITKSLIELSDVTGKIADENFIDIKEAKAVAKVISGLVANVAVHNVPTKIPELNLKTRDSRTCTKKPHQSNIWRS